ncbi:hypothetical protein ACGFXC_36910 [Streptomyces sp. NPDC048507]|uniref:hypothetical protein n=1 Tax=Streptomyces sp. NPDC048507 TaxID=3365560 RepID=UPI00371F4540
MTPTQTRTRTPLDVAHEVPTGQLLDRLMTLAGEARAGAPNAVEIAAAASALQQRCGRLTRTRHFDPADQAAKLVKEVSDEGGILALSADVVRRGLMAAMREDMRAVEQDPKGGHVVRTHVEILGGHGLGVFPGPALPAGAMFTVLYERELLLGQLLAALTAGEDVAALVEEVTVAAG